LARCGKVFLAVNPGVVELVFVEAERLWHVELVLDQQAEGLRHRKVPHTE